MSSIDVDFYSIGVLFDLMNCILRDLSESACWLFEFQNHTYIPTLKEESTG